MGVLVAYTLVSVLTLFVFRLTIRARWRRRSIQDLLSQTSLNCRQLRDLEKALKQAYQESGIPRLLLTGADLLTVLCVAGAVLAWVYLPAWYLALGATVALTLLFTVLFYEVLEFGGPWWRFPAAYVRSRLDCEACHDWDGCQCRVCRTSRHGGHRWNRSCQCTICGEVRHQWKGASCARCGAKREEASVEHAYLKEQAADARELLAPFSSSRPIDSLHAQ